MTGTDSAIREGVSAWASSGAVRDASSELGTTEMNGNCDSERTSADHDRTNSACALAHHLDACAVKDEAIPEALLGDVALEDAGELVAPGEVVQQPGRLARLFQDGVGQAAEMMRVDEEDRRRGDVVRPRGAEVLQSRQRGRYVDRVECEDSIKKSSKPHTAFRLDQLGAVHGGEAGAFEQRGVGNSSSIGGAEGVRRDDSVQGG